jgi:hypothetical protein
MLARALNERVGERHVVVGVWAGPDVAHLARTGALMMLPEEAEYFLALINQARDE